MNKEKSTMLFATISFIITILGFTLAFHLGKNSAANELSPYVYDISERTLYLEKVYNVLNCKQDTVAVVQLPSTGKYVVVRVSLLTK